MAPWPTTQLGALKGINLKNLGTKAENEKNSRNSKDEKPLILLLSVRIRSHRQLELFYIFLA
jgi:hypothetical protein